MIGTDAVCIHDPYEEMPASQCFICNGGIKAERVAESQAVLRRSRGTVSNPTAGSDEAPTFRVAKHIDL